MSTAKSHSHEEDLRALGELLETIDILRGPEGCPWDRRQTTTSLVPALIEECYEVVDAIRSERPEHLQEELGDLLLLTLFMGAISRDAGDFAIADLAGALQAKLVRRHPHVFGDVESKEAEAVRARWDKIKAQERRGLMEGIPRALPALKRAQKIGRRAASVGFDWPDSSAVLSKVHEELVELEEAIADGDRAHCREELGDLLFALTNLARKLRLDSEESLELANEKFFHRFEAVEAQARAAQRSLDECSLETLDGYWESAKAQEKERHES